MDVGTPLQAFASLSISNVQVLGFNRRYSSRPGADKLNDNGNAANALTDAPVFVSTGHSTIIAPYFNNPVLRGEVTQINLLEKPHAFGRVGAPP